MKKFFISIIALIITTSLFAQEGSLGLFVGGGYYVGELNPRSVFYHPSPAFGIRYNHIFNERWILRFEVNYSNIKGSDASSSNSYQTQRGHAFSNRIFDLGAQGELNLKNYQTDYLLSDYFSPYFTAGALLSVLPDADKEIELAIPIGIGFKYAVTNNITAGLEWTYRWSNSDRVDLLPDDNFLEPDKQMSNNPDTDWYSFVGVVVSFRVFKDNSTCPVF